MRLIVLLSLGLITLACDTTAPMVREDVRFRVLLQSSGFFAASANIPDGGQERVPPASVALASEMEEAEFLDGYPRNSYWVDGDGPLHVPFPDVNYQTETAIVVALGTGGSGSISVRVDSVVSDGQRAIVYTTTVLPCVGTRDSANPAVIAALEGHDREVGFAETATERRDCF